MTLWPPVTPDTNRDKRPQKLTYLTSVAVRGHRGSKCHKRKLLASRTLQLWSLQISSALGCYNVLTKSYFNQILSSSESQMTKNQRRNRQTGGSIIPKTFMHQNIRTLCSMFNSSMCNVQLQYEKKTIMQNAMISVMWPYVIHTRYLASLERGRWKGEQNAICSTRFDSSRPSQLTDTEIIIRILNSHQVIYSTRHWDKK